MDLLPLKPKPPQQGDVVRVKIVKNDSDTGVNVIVLDFPGIEGFIQLSNMVRGRRLKNRKALKLNSEFPAVVTESVNGGKILTLSKKHVDPEKVTKFDEEYHTLCRLRTVGYTVYVLMKKYNEHYIGGGVDKEDVMRNSVWRLIKDYESDDEDSEAKDLFEAVLTNLDILFNEFFDKKFQKWCKGKLKKRIQMGDVEVGLDLEMVSYTGIETIKEIFATFAKEYPDIGFECAVPGHYVLKKKDINRDEIEVELGKAAEFLKGLCSEKHVKFLKKETRLLKKPDIRFSPLNDDSRIEFDVESTDGSNIST